MANYYVKVGGDDELSGLTDNLAWETIDKVNGFTGFVAGDIVSFNRGDTFLISGDVGFTPEERSITKATALRSPIDDLTFNAYGTGARPVISGNGNWGAVTMVDGYTRDDITFNGLRFQDGQTVSGVIGSTCYENGTTFAYHGDGLTLIDCVFDGSSSFENCIVGTSTIHPSFCLNYIIQGCTFQNTQMRAGLYLNNIDGLLVENCTFLNNIGYDTYESKYEGSGIKINHGGQNQVIRNNWIENNHKSFSAGSFKDSIFYNNVVISENTPVEAGFCLSFGTQDDGNGVDNAKVYYNTFIMRDADNQHYDIYISNYGEPIAPTDMDFKNNVIYAEGQGAGVEYLIQVRTGQEPPDSDYNIWWTPAGGNVRWAELGVTPSPYSWALWQTAGHDLNGLNDDPDFVAYGSKNFALLSGSPAIGAATPVVDQSAVAILTDYNGNPRDAVNPDMGAYEYQVPATTEETYNMII